MLTRKDLAVPNSRYFMRVFGAQRNVFPDPAAAHTYATFWERRALPDGTVNEPAAIISWLPESGVINILGPSEPGRNYTLAETERFVDSVGANLRWESPETEITQAFFTSAHRRIAQLSDAHRTVQYAVCDVGKRPNQAADSIHALSDIPLAVQDLGLIATGPLLGIAASQWVYYWFDRYFVRTAPETGDDEAEIERLWRHRVLAVPSSRTVLVDPNWGDPSGQTVSPLLFGHNTVWSRGGLGLWDADAQMPHKETLRLVKALDLGALRLPGGTRAMRYRFHETIGSGRRTPQCDTFVGECQRDAASIAFGFDEYLRYAKEELAVDGRRPAVSLVSSWVDGSPQQTAAMVAYANRPVHSPLENVKFGADGNGFDWGYANDWAQLRKKNRREAPYGVEFLEIGNEQYLVLQTPPKSTPPLGCKSGLPLLPAFKPSERIWYDQQTGDYVHETTTSAKHLENVQATCDLVRRAVGRSGIKIGVSACSPAVMPPIPLVVRLLDGTNVADARSFEDESTPDPARRWNYPFRQGPGGFDDFDFFVLHSYDHESALFADPLEQATKLDETISQLCTLNPTKPVAVTEYGRLQSAEGILGTLTAAHVLKVCIERSVLAAFRHLLIEDCSMADLPRPTKAPYANNAALLRPYGSDRTRTLPVYWAMKRLRETVRGITVPVPAPSAANLACFATRDATGGGVVLIRSGGPRRMEVVVTAPPGTSRCAAQSLWARNFLTSNVHGVGDQQISATKIDSRRWLLELRRFSLTTVRFLP